MKQKVSVRMLCQIAMLIALEIVLSRFCSISTPAIRIGFAFVPIMLCGMLFGPLWAGAAYGIADLIGAALFSTGVFPGIIIARVVSGLLYGLLLHTDEVKFVPHILCTVLADQIICSLGITALTLAIRYDTPYTLMLVTRLPQAGIMLAIELAVIPLLLKLKKSLKKAGLSPA